MSYNHALELIRKEKREKTGKLSFHYRSLTKLPEYIKELTHLQFLNLYNNEISDIRFLENLDNLQSLDLRSNQIKDISPLKNLKNLHYLDIRSNRISDISFLKDLHNLQSLDLGNNEISNISFLKDLHNLQLLDLSENKISDISPLSALINKGLKVSVDDYIQGINLKNNPITKPPIEIVKRGNRAIRRYFKDIASQGKDKLYEAKLLIVGEGESGKTTLARKIKDIKAPMPRKEDERTMGIDVEPIYLENMNDADKSFRMNVWDFGGQEIYHATHQFFLTKRSLYLIVNNTRSNLTDFNYWLETVSILSDASPVIIVQNEVSGSSTDLDLKGLQQYFSNILYKRDADLSNITDGRLEKLIRDIGIEIQRLDHVGSELPKQWVVIRNALKEKAKDSPYITDKEFYETCIVNKIVEKDAMQRLGDFLHDLGVFLHFRDEPTLGSWVILQNTWATKGVYRILDDAVVKRQKGQFSYADAVAIWENSPFENMQDALLQLMSKFELCYQIPYQRPINYVSPQLLPVEKPDYKWDETDNLMVYYEYKFMPKGLLGRLIVRLHRYIKDINTLAWRTGCIFTNENTDAQVIETYGVKTIEVRIKGEHRANLATIITKEVDELNASYPKLKVDKMIPCNCKTCQKKVKPHFYKYETLMYRKKRKKITIECDVSFEDVPITSLLDLFVQPHIKTKSIQESIKSGKIEDALFEFQKTYDEGTLLYSQYSKGKHDYEQGTIQRGEWDAICQRIGKSILEIMKEN